MRGVKISAEMLGESRQLPYAEHMKLTVEIDGVECWSDLVVESEEMDAKPLLVWMADLLKRRLEAL